MLNVLEIGFYLAKVLYDKPSNELTHAIVSDESSVHMLENLDKLISLLVKCQCLK